MSAATAKLRVLLLKRADNRCECGCGRWLGDDAQMDHQQGRARSRERLENCWMLTAKCHREKTDSVGGAASWLEKFAGHCRTYGYTNELKRVEARLVFATVRAELGRRGAA